MKLKEFLEHLEGRDPEMEVVVRVNGEEIEDGDILDVVDERSIIVEYGKLTILADLPEE